MTNTYTFSIFVKYQRPKIAWRLRYYIIPTPFIAYVEDWRRVTFTKLNEAHANRLKKWTSSPTSADAELFFLALGGEARSAQLEVSTTQSSFIPTSVYVSHNVDVRTNLIQNSEDIGNTWRKS